MSCRLKHLAVATAIIGLATHVQAGYFAGSTDFEEIDLSTSGYWSDIGDASIETVAPATPAGGRATYRPTWFTSTNKVLSVDNDVDAPIVCDLGGEAATIYADVLVKGYPLASDAAAPEYGSSDKILVYTRAAGSVTNLCVFAKDANSDTNEFVLTKTVDNGWHRIIIKAANGAYQVYCDDPTTPCTDGTVSTFYPLNAVAQGSAAISSVAFAGSGSVDDLILSDLIPEQPVYTVTWDTTLASVKYSADGGLTTNDLTVADGQYQFQSSTPITIIANNGFRTFDDTYTLSTPTHALVVPTGLAYYTDGDGTEQNPYEIPCYEALIAMKELVASTASYRSAYYVQTADIDFEGKPAFAGIGAYQKVPTSGTPFTGTYDGQGHTIKNVTRAGENTQGIFNQVGVGGVIENLVVSNMVFDAGVTDEYGFAIVGNAGGGATLRNLTAAGVFASAEKPGTHNMAGIVVRLSPGATTGAATTIDSCTNNATIYGGYTKLGGINAIVQDQTGFKNGKVVFVNCANNGTLVCKRTKAQAEATNGAVTGNAGIVGYISGTNVELTNCYGNGAITNVDGANTDKDGALVGWTYGGTIKDNGGNSAPVDKKMIGTWGSATETGFLYATVANGIATTIAPPYTLAKDTEYLLEGNVAAGAVFTLAAAGDTFVVNTALQYSFAGTVDAASPFVATPSTSGTVTTYTAGYFPRTATAGQNGTAANPFEIADADDIVALKAAFAADSTYRSKNYKVVADIDATDLGYWAGIGAQATANTGLSNATFDGAGHIISNLSFDNSDNTRKYRGFFNRADGSVIKDLTINVVGFKDMTDPALEHGYAAFVGNMDNTTLLRCKATGTLGTTAKPTMHTTAGLAVKVASSGTFVDCTNYVNIVCSLNDNPKVGGILGLLNGGSATVSNCWNFGSLTATPAGVVNSANGVGGLVGYTQGNLTIYGGGNEGTVEWTKTTAAATENEAISVGTIIGMETGSGKSATVSGGVVAQADAAPAGNYIAQISGLSFATVSGNVATFVPTLASNNTYKVMMDGATATYNFAAPGTIAFDTTMYTPTYAITAAEGLDLSDDTVNNVKTYTAAVAVTGFDDPEGNEITDQDVIDWLTAKGFDQEDINALGQNAAGTAKLNECYLLNCDITEAGAGGTLSITAITVGANVQVTVALDRTGDLGAINGTLKLYGTSALGTAFAEIGSVTFSDDDFSDGDTTTATFSAGQNKFFKAVIE